MAKSGDKVKQPKQGDSVTQDQIDSALNIDSFSGATADKNWHQGADGGGLYEPWTKDYGYPECYALYGGVKVKDVPVHIYYLANVEQTILLKKGEQPANYKK
jgi:hypothetical protein